MVDPYANPDRSIILVELAHPDGDVEVIETTDNHPFFVTDKGWTRVDALGVGDEVPSSDGRFLVVVGLTWTDRIETVYNFGVEGFHTYFVGESGAWVHNCSPTDKIVETILKGQRKSTALTKDDAHHRAASFVTEEQVRKGKMVVEAGGDGVEVTKVYVEGGVNDASGIFEFVVDVMPQLELEFPVPAAYDQLDLRQRGKHGTTKTTHIQA